MTERKVKLATLASYLGTLALLGALEAVNGAPEVALIPAPWGPLLVALLPGALTFVGGYVARHTWRSDPQVARQAPLPVRRVLVAQWTGGAAGEVRATGTHL